MSMTDYLGRYVDHVTTDCRGIGPTRDNVVADVLLEAPEQEVSKQHAVVINGIRGETFEGQSFAAEVLDGSKDQLVFSSTVLQADDAVNSGVMT